MRVCVPLKNVGIAKEEEQGEEMQRTLLLRSPFPFQIKTDTFRSVSEERTNGPFVWWSGKLKETKKKKNIPI